MQKELTLTKEQNEAFTLKMKAELNRITMSWDNDLKSWYQTALRALNFASVVSLGIKPQDFVDLFKQEPQGLNMQIVMTLVNNCDARTSVEMEVTAKDWAHFLVLNASIGARWNELHRPVYKKVYKEFEIMVSRPKMILAANNI